MQSTLPTCILGMDISWYLIKLRPVGAYINFFCCNEFGREKHIYTPKGKGHSLCYIYHQWRNYRGINSVKGKGMYESTYPVR